MPLPFQKKPTVEDYDGLQDLETAKGQYLTKKKENEELEAGIKELKQKYGPGWRKILGLGSKVSLADIRVFLQGAKKGLEKSEGSTSRQNQMLSPIVSGGITQRSRQPSSGGSLSVLPPSGIRRA
jgi:hypothetical protein